jgi:anti-anti-sigma factor
MIKYKNNTIYIEQKLTFDTLTLEQENIKEFINKNNSSEFILDFSKTLYIDSSGLGFLLLIKELIEKQNSTLILSNINNKSAQMVFEIANFNKIFNIKY